MARLRTSPSGRALDLLTFSSTAASLPTTLYVDRSTLIDLEDQNGSAVAPYASLTQAVAHANARNAPAWHFIISFGDYRDEPSLELLPNRRYVFEGVLRVPSVMSLPALNWHVTGNRTSQVVVRNCSVGLISVIDEPVPAVNAILIFQGSECNGIDSAFANSFLTVVMTGTSLASFETVTTPVVEMVCRANPLLIRSGIIFAQNCQFEASCTKIECSQLLADGCSFSQDIELSDTSFEARTCKWLDGPHTLEFSGLEGTAFLDGSTQHYFDLTTVVLVNGSIIATDQHYDHSSVIPLPEGSTTGQATFGTLTTFAGASYRLIGFASANRLYLIATAVSAPTTVVIAIYQSQSGQTTPPIPLVGVATLLLTAPGTFLVPLAAILRLNPGIAFFLVGKVAGGGNVTIRTYATPTQELLNDASVPSNVYPTAFTTTIGVTASPPATFDPTPAGGLVTPSGASNVTPILRLATV